MTGFWDGTQSVDAGVFTEECMAEMLEVMRKGLDRPYEPEPVIVPLWLLRAIQDESAR